MTRVIDLFPYPLFRRDYVDVEVEQGYDCKRPIKAWNRDEIGGGIIVTGLFSYGPRAKLAWSTYMVEKRPQIAYTGRKSTTRTSLCHIVRPIMFQKSLGIILLLLSRPDEVREMSQDEESCNDTAQSRGDG